VSLWLHKELRVVICPDQVALWPVRRALSVRGLRRAIRDPHSVPCNPATGIQAWRAALQALETSLPDFAEHNTVATVILSNHFVRYALVPWRAELADADEELSFARHCFTKVYGKAAQQWELRLSPEASAMSRLASAVDTELHDGLKAVFDGAGIPLRSVQPHLMAAFNGFRGRLPQQNAWFALLEPDNLCLALLQQGHWSRVRSLRIDSAWQEELPLILEREAYLADDPAVPHDVYVLTTALDDTAPLKIDPWQFHALGTGMVHDTMAAQGRPIAMAMAG
jgi:hypothetical protein